MVDHYTYRITWSAEDQEHVGRCAELPSLSWLAPTGGEALSGIQRLVDEVVEDQRSATPWTARALALIEAHPATRAGDLAPAMGWDTPKFKANVRKLKALGLTQSLEVGYRLTDLGARVVQMGRG